LIDDLDRCRCLQNGEAQAAGAGRNRVGVERCRSRSGFFGLDWRGRRSWRRLRFYAGLFRVGARLRTLSRDSDLGERSLRRGCSRARRWPGLRRGGIYRQRKRDEARCGDEERTKRGNATMFAAAIVDRHNTTPRRRKLPVTATFGRSASRLRPRQRLETTEPRPTPGHPAPTRSRVTTADGRSPGSRVATFRRLPGTEIPVDV
jgi:hypothetical protein